MLIVKLLQLVYQEGFGDSLPIYLLKWRKRQNKFFCFFFILIFLLLFELYIHNKSNSKQWQQMVAKKEQSLQMVLEINLEKKRDQLNKGSQSV